LRTLAYAVRKYFQLALSGMKKTNNQPCVKYAIRRETNIKMLSVYFYLSELKT